MTIKSALMALVAVFAVNQAVAADPQAHSAPAVQGYDVVSYQTLKRPVRGSGHFVSTHDGATYLFASIENKQAFEADPERYVPAYNGYCAFGVANGKKFAGDPEVWRVVDGRLYLNLDANIQDLWLKDVPGQIKAGDRYWKDIKDKSPASLL